MTNLNFFSNFGKYTANLAGTGRFLLYHAQRGTLPRDGVQEFFDIFFRGWCEEHPKTARAFYAGTRLYPNSIWDTTNREIRQLGAPVPTCFTNGVQLYSLNGTGGELRWFEVAMYVSIAQGFLRKISEGSKQDKTK